MAKTTLTNELERSIWEATSKLGVFTCFEVTIGLGGKERVDYMTYDTKGIWRCYEIKVSLQDFRSKAKTTFCGHYNYYVMTEDLFKKVGHEIPSHIGVYIDGSCRKKAKRQELTVGEEELRLSLIRSLSRETDKAMRSESVENMLRMKRQISRLEKEVKSESRRRRELENALYVKFGRKWQDEIENV